MVYLREGWFNHVATPLFSLGTDHLTRISFRLRETCCAAHVAAEEAAPARALLPCSGSFRNDPHAPRPHPNEFLTLNNSSRVVVATHQPARQSVATPQLPVRPEAGAQGEDRLPRHKRYVAETSTVEIMNSMFRVLDRNDQVPSLRFGAALHSSLIQFPPEVYVGFVRFV